MIQIYVIVPHPPASVWYVTDTPAALADQIVAGSTCYGLEPVGDTGYPSVRAAADALITRHQLPMPETLAWWSPSDHDQLVLGDLESYAIDEDHVHTG